MANGHQFILTVPSTLYLPPYFTSEVESPAELSGSPHKGLQEPNPTEPWLAVSQQRFASLATWDPFARPPWKTTFAILTDACRDLCLTQRHCGCVVTLRPVATSGLQQPHGQSQQQQLLRGRSFRTSQGTDASGSMQSMHTVAAGIMEHSIKHSSNNSRQTNILPELQLGAICAAEVSRKLAETSSLPGPED